MVTASRSVLPRKALRWMSDTCPGCAPWVLLACAHPGDCSNLKRQHTPKPRVKRSVLRGVFDSSSNERASFFVFVYSYFFVGTSSPLRLTIVLADQTELSRRDLTSAVDASRASPSIRLAALCRDGLESRWSPRRNRTRQWRHG